jgi:hypothetical protein
MSRVLQAGFTGLAAIILLSSTALFQPGAARILCQGEFQVTNMVSSPPPTARMRRLPGSRIATGGTGKPLRSALTL